MRESYEMLGNGIHHTKLLFIRFWGFAFLTKAQDNICTITVQSSKVVFPVNSVCVSHDSKVDTVCVSCSELFLEHDND